MKVKKEEGSKVDTGGPESGGPGGPDSGGPKSDGPGGPDSSGPKSGGPGEPDSCGPRSCGPQRLLRSRPISLLLP